MLHSEIGYINKFNLGKYEKKPGLKKNKSPKQKNHTENDPTSRPIIQPITKPLEQNSEVLKKNRRK